MYFLANPSAIFDGTETAALLIWLGRFSGSLA
jgi:hypothetical protein